MPWKRDLAIVCTLKKLRLFSSQEPQAVPQRAIRRFLMFTAPILIAALRFGLLIEPALGGQPRPAGVLQ